MNDTFQSSTFATVYETSSMCEDPSAPMFAIKSQNGRIRFAPDRLGAWN
jgi:hypothetical protein